jgi:hypothetical protein
MRKRSRKLPAAPKPTQQKLVPIAQGGASFLNALTASAMALPGLAGSASAESPVEEMTIEGDYSYYREDKLRPKKTVFGGERDRMEIHSYKFRVATPISDRADLEVDGGFETLTGASPWYVLPDPAPGLPGGRDGRPIQVMSGATIDENRGDMLVKGNYFFDRGKASVSTGFSIENDYYSVNFGVGGERSFNDNNTTLSLGAGTSLDWIEPTDCKTLDRVCSETKQSFSIFAGISQVLTRHSAIQSTISFGYATGYLSDPYKRAFIEVFDDGSTANTVRDERPDDRKQFTWLTKYRHHVSGLDGTLHLDYRLYVDDWSINSHTFDVAWHQSLPFNIQIIPSIRYYSQSQTDFYEVFYSTERSDGFHSSDYRLSPYGAFSWRLKATADVEDLFGSLDAQLALSYERYESSAGLAFQRVDVENPGLVAFNLFAARLTFKF